MALLQFMESVEKNELIYNKKYATYTDYFQIMFVNDIDNN